MVKFLFLFIISFFSISIHAIAQSQGSISGIVLNGNTKQPVAGATVTVDGTNQSVFADSSGRYRITGIQTGSYTITVSTIGYETVSRFNIVITSGNENELSFELQPRTSELA